MTPYSRIPEITITNDGTSKPPRQQQLRVEHERHERAKLNTIQSLTISVERIENKKVGKKDLDFVFISIVGLLSVPKKGFRLDLFSNLMPTC